MVKHHTHLLKKLREKGWSDKELEYALDVMSQSHTHKSSLQKFVDAIMPWFLFIAIASGNILVMFAIIPLLVFMPNIVLYGLLAILGFCFGFLFEVIIKDLKHTFLIHHHLIMHILLPIIAVIGGGFVFLLSNMALPHLIVFERLPFFLAAVYIFFFILPTLLSRFFIYEHYKDDVVKE